MKDLMNLIKKFDTEIPREISKEEHETYFTMVLSEIEQFYTDNLSLNSYEVAIFLTNKEKTILSFACPAYLVNSGMIPVSSTEAYSATVFRTGRGIIENKLQQQKHLGIFEIIRTPDSKLMPLWKMMAALIAIGDEKIGVIEISRRGTTEDDAGENFTQTDLELLDSTIKILAPYIKKVMPENFRGKIT